MSSPYWIVLCLSVVMGAKQLQRGLSPVSERKMSKTRTTQRKDGSKQPPQLGRAQLLLIGHVMYVM